MRTPRGHDLSPQRQPHVAPPLFLSGSRSALPMRLCAQTNLPYQSVQFIQEDDARLGSPGVIEQPVKHSFTLPFNEIGERTHRSETLEKWPRKSMRAWAHGRASSADQNCRLSSRTILNAKTSDWLTLVLGENRTWNH